MWIIIAQAAWAQDSAVQWSPIVQLRPRLEVHTGRDAAPDGEDFFVSHRARGGVVADGGRVTGAFVLQDARVWGSELSTLADFSADGLDLPIARLTVDIGERWSLDVGRDERVVHGQRLIGAVGWTQQGRSFDGLVLHHQRGDWSGELATNIVLDDTAVAVTGVDETLLVSWLRAGRSTDALTTDVLVISENVSEVLSAGSRNFTRVTAGAYVKGEAGIVSGRLEGYAQVGEGQRKTVSAGMVGVRGSVAPETTLKPKVTLWYDVLSGDDRPGDNELHAFDTLYATNHKFYGLIDIVGFSRGAMVDGRGLHDAALKLDLKPGATTVHLDGHVFAAAVLQGGDALIGQEIDAWAQVPLTDGLALAGGGALFLHAADGSEPEAWGFCQLDATLR